MSEKDPRLKTPGLQLVVKSLLESVDAIEKVAYGDAVQADVEDFWKVGQVLGHVTQKVKDLFAKKADMVAFDEKRIKCLVANPSLSK